MNNKGNLFWRGSLVCRLTNISLDLFYFDANWESIQSNEANTFIEKAKRLKSQDVYRHPEKGLVAMLYIEGATPTPVLILALKRKGIFMRMISNEIAASVDETWSHR